jgi:NADH:ubiquinone oxidoreductase subunit 6 (subunit J)
MIIFVLFFNICIHLLVGLILFGIFGGLFPFLIYENFVNFFLSNFLPFVIMFLSFLSLKLINPIYILLNILFFFILTSFLLFNLSCEILTFIFLIVYLGALMMLFLFVIMLFNLQKLQKVMVKYPKKSTFFLIFYISLIFLISTFNVNLIFFTGISPWLFFLELDFFTIFFFSNITANGNIVFKSLFLEEHGFFILFLTILLLFSMIAAITIALLTRENTKI